MCPHGIMFHHFHNEKHLPAQGSILAEELADMIIDLKKDYNLLSADDWYRKAISNILEPKDICLTFDDNLRCQFDIAFPVLKDFNIKAFWFIITSPLNKKAEKLEIYRYYRTTQFSHINEFYNVFNDVIRNSKYRKEVDLALRESASESYLLQQAPFYSSEDRIFRYIRDVVLGTKKYEELMDSMIANSKFRIDDKLLNLLWMDEACLHEIRKDGQIIGLHSHTHPVNLGQLSKNEQRAEYKTNLRKLKQILNEDINSMSHPSDSYNEATLGILKEMNILIGFKASMMQKQYSKLECPRLDASALNKSRK